jgi:membrane-associated protease RseP (regulator of RpoE activity)
MSMFSIYIFYFLAAILLHEFGHLAAAWACSVTVREFGLGWGRQLLRFRLRTINCVVRILPIGAYVRLDMIQLRTRPLSQQVLVLLAGIIANLIVAAVAGGTRFGLVNYLLAATNILPLYQQDGWKCGMVMLRGSFQRKSPLPEWTFTLAGGGLSLTLMAAAILSWI